MVNETLLKKLESLSGMSVFCMKQGEEEIHSFGILPEEEQLLVHTPDLIKRLKEQADGQSVPVIHKEQEKVYFICIKGENEYYFVGPICRETMSYVELHQLYKLSKERLATEKYPVRMKLPKMLLYVSFLAELLTDRNIETEELMNANGLGMDEEKMTDKDIMQQEQEELVDEAYHHTYLEERYVMDRIRNGDVDAALERWNLLIEKAGTLSEKEFNDKRNLAIVSVTIATREAIAGGVSPTEAYKLSDKMINQIDHCTKLEEVEEMCRSSIIKFAQLVAETQKKRDGSNYTEQCKEYIARNYHHKIYLEEIAEAIGISQGHLARIFHRDTGMKVQEYMLKFRIERASNLLKYSEASLAEISDYVCFNSQSHFGSVFKKYMGMTPGQYRNKYKRKEFRS